MRIDRKGVSYVAADYSHRIKSRTGDLAEPKLSNMTSSEKSAFLSGLFETIGEVELKVLLQSRTTFNFEAEDTKMHETTDHDVDEVLTSDEIAKIVKKNREGVYYLIRAVKSARRIYFGLNENQIRDIGGEAAVQAFASKGKLNVNHIGNSGMVLNKTFEKPHFYKFLPEPLLPTKAGMAGKRDLERSGKYDVKVVFKEYVNETK